MTGRTAPPALRSRSGMRLIGAVVIVTAVWLAGLFALGVSAKVDRTCISCHSMRPYEQAMESTAHRSVGCVACHGTSGPAGVVVDGLALSRRISAALVGRPPSGSGLQSDSACRSCHAQALSQIVTANGVAVRHADFVATACTECHAGTGHALADRVYFAPHMDDCLTCHRTSASNLDGCRLCHVGLASGPRDDRSAAWRVTHGPTWQTTHGGGDLGACASCHPSDYCVRCHGTRVPHAPMWARGHGEGTRAATTESCETCHDPAWCDRCHGIEMPHPSGFMAQHPATTDGISEARCLRCHEAETCNGCHLRSAHPSIPGVDFRHRPGDS